MVISPIWFWLPKVLGWFRIINMGCVRKIACDYCPLTFHSIPYRWYWLLLLACIPYKKLEEVIISNTNRFVFSLDSFINKSEGDCTLAPKLFIHWINNSSRLQDITNSVMRIRNINLKRFSFFIYGMCLLWWCVSPDDICHKLN